MAASDKAARAKKTSDKGKGQRQPADVARTRSNAATVKAEIGFDIEIRSFPNTSPTTR